MKKVVLSAVITLLIIGFAGALFFYFKKSSFFRAEPSAAVPPDAALFVTGSSASNSFFYLFENRAWKNVHHGSNGALAFLDSLIRNDKTLRPYWLQQPFCVSLHITRSNRFDYLFLMNVTDALSENAVAGLVEQAAGKSFARRRYESVMIREVAVAGGTFTYAVSHGVFIASFTPFLVESAIRQLKTGPPVTSGSAFRQAQLQLPGSELTCFVSYPGLSGLLANFTAARAEPLTRYLFSAASWSALEASIQSHSILLNGLTVPGDSSQTFSVFDRQLPVPNTCGEVLSDRAAFILSYGFSDPGTFLASAARHTACFDPPAVRGKQLKALTERYKMNVEDKLTSWLGNSMGLLVTEPGNSNFTNNCFAFFSARSAAEAKKKLDDLRRRIQLTEGSPDRQETYRRHTIGYLDVPDVARLAYGRLFDRISRFYYTTLRNVVVAGNSASALRSLIDDYEEGRVLAASPAGKSALHSVSNVHNLFLFLRPPAMEPMTRYYGLTTGPAEELDEAAALAAFSSITANISMHDGAMATSLVLNTEQAGGSGMRLTASARLDTSLRADPCLFAVPGADLSRLAAQTADGTLYILDETGEILWKRVMNEAILGPVTPVDYFHNGGVQLLFVTASALHLVDLNGQYVGNYPIRLPSAASFAPTILPGTDSRPLSVYVNCTNGQVYAYELSGKPIDNWLYNGNLQGLRQPLLPWIFRGKSCLASVNLEGMVTCFDERGSELHPWTDLPPLDAGATLRRYSLLPSHKDAVLAYAAAGRIVVLFPDGRHEIRALPEGLDATDFAVISAGEDEDPALALLGSGGLTAVDAEGDTLYHTPVRVYPAAQFLPLPGCHTAGGCLFTDGADKSFLLDGKGNVAEGFPLKGTAFTCRKRTGGDKEQWAAGDSEGNIYFYEWEDAAGPPAAH
jgi:hypothetical protein